MKINLLNLTMEEVPLKYEDITAYAYDLFWDMADYSSYFCIQFNNYMHNGIPQPVWFEITDMTDTGYYLTDDSHIVIKDQKRNKGKMKKAIEHELVHLFLVEALGINPDHTDHPVEFWEFLRRFKRFRRKALRER